MDHDCNWLNTIMISQLFDVSQASNSSHSTCRLDQVFFGTQDMLGPPRLVNNDLGTQMILMPTCSELITSLALVAIFALSYSKEFEFTIFGLESLPFGHSLLKCPLSRQV